MKTRYQRTTTLVLCSATALLLGGMAVQDQNRQDRVRSQDRPDTQTTQQDRMQPKSQHLQHLTPLAGTWKVEMTVDSQRPAGQQGDREQLQDGQLQQKLSEALQEAGADQQTAQRQAEQLARQIQSAQTERQKAALIQNALLQAGAEPAEARTQAQQLVEQTGDRQQPDRNRTATGQQAGQPVMTGYAVRHWEVDGKVLVERVKLQPAGADNERNRQNQEDFRDRDATDQDEADNPRATGGAAVGQQDRRADKPGHNKSMSGFGFICWDQAADKFNHVWVDSHKGSAILSLGEYNPSDRTFTFTQHYGEGKTTDTTDRYRTVRDRQNEQDRDDAGASTDRVQKYLVQSLQTAGLEADDAEQAATQIIRTLAQDPAETELQSRIEGVLTEHGVDQTQAQQRARTIASTVATLHRESGQTPERDRPDYRATGGQESSDDPTVTLKVISDDKHVITMKGMDENGQHTGYTITFTRTSDVPQDMNQQGFGQQRDRQQTDQTQQPRELSRDNIHAMVTSVLQRAGVEPDQLKETADEITHKIVEDIQEGDTEDMAEKVAAEIEDAGVDSTRARLYGNEIVRQVQRMRSDG